MDPNKSSFFLAPKQSGMDYLKPDMALGLLLLFAAIVSFGAYLTINYDAAFGIATKSRALYVDEGFYSDAAQNFVKFGAFGLPFDSRHWPGAPLLTVIQTLFFSIFGVSLTVARMISIIFGVISLLSIYSIARTKLSPLISLSLAIVAVLTFNFTAHSRVAIADPIATGFSLLAIATFVRLSNRNWAIPVSVFFAYMALCSKMYFLFALVTIVTVWLVELIAIPIVEKKKINLRQVFILIASLCLIALSYALLRIRFEPAFTQFLHINSNKIPSLNLHVLSKQLYASIKNLPFNSKTHISLAALGAILAYWIMMCLYIRRFSSLKQKLIEWGRAGWSLSIFLLLGLCTVAALNLPDKAHYQYFSILPIICLSVFVIDATFPQRIKTKLIMGMLASQLVFQAPYYYQWLNRSDRSVVHEANVAITSLIEDNSNSDVISVMGQYSSQLALYSDRMVSLEVRWVTQEGLCQRFDYWRPEYFLNFVFPMRYLSEGDRLAQCEGLAGFEEIGRFVVNEFWKDELILYRLIYAE